MIVPGVTRSMLRVLTMENDWELRNLGDGGLRSGVLALGRAEFAASSMELARNHMFG